MAIKKITKKQEMEFKLPSAMDIVYAEEFWEEMSQLLTTQPSEVILNGSNVTRITTSCIQIILSTAKTLQDLGNKLKIKNPSAIMNEVFSDLGLSNKLEEWSATK